jgi:hypothetical protein
LLPFFVSFESFVVLALEHHMLVPARAHEADQFIEFDIAACEIDPDNEARPGLTVAWGGSKFEMQCLLTDVLFVRRHIRRGCPAVWLHNTDCRMYSPESFATEFAAERSAVAERPRD